MAKSIDNMNNKCREGGRSLQSRYAPSARFRALLLQLAPPYGLRKLRRSFTKSTLQSRSSTEELKEKRLRMEKIMAGTLPARIGARRKVMHDRHKQFRGEILDLIAAVEL